MKLTREEWIERFSSKLASKLKYRYLDFNISLYQFIANCVNETISEVVKRNNRILEIE
jgi:predicted Zn-dependent protease